MERQRLKNTGIIIFVIMLMAVTYFISGCGEETPVSPDTDASLAPIKILDAMDKETWSICASQTKETKNDSDMPRQPQNTRAEWDEENGEPVKDEEGYYRKSEYYLDIIVKNGKKEIRLRLLIKPWNVNVEGKMVYYLRIYPHDPSDPEKLEDEYLKKLLEKIIAANRRYNKNLYHDRFGFPSIEIIKKGQKVVIIIPKYDEDGKKQPPTEIEINVRRNKK